MTASPINPATDRGLDVILHNLQAEFFSDHMRVMKGKDTPAEMDENNADTLARAKQALKALLVRERIDEVEQIRTGAVMGIAKNSTTLRDYAKERIAELKRKL